MAVAMQQPKGPSPAHPRKRPSIVFLNRVYPPDLAASGQLLADLATALVKSGFDVTVLTTRSVAESPRREVLGGVQVRRVRTLAFTRAAVWKRALSYLSIYPAFLFAGFRLPRPDVIVTMTDPPLHLTLGPVLKRYHRCRLVHWAQDLYPEVAEELGVLPRNGLAARLLRTFSSWGLRSCDAVIAIGECMRQRLLNRKLNPAAVEMIPNWALSAVEATAPEVDDFRRQHGLMNRFIVMYSGNFGLAHTFGALLEAAREIESRLPEVCFVFVGDGSTLDQVKMASRDRNNVRFLPMQPQGGLATSLGSADIHVATMRDEVVGLVVPSKVYGVLAAGKPCVFIGPRESEAARLIDRFHCGATFAPTDGPGVARWIAEAATDPKILQALRAAARRAALEVHPAKAFDHMKQFFENLLFRG